MLKDAEKFDFVRFDREFQAIADMALEAYNINNQQGK
jgi:hypothetical protein